jgi:predicted transcriptional regulator
MLKALKSKIIRKDKIPDLEESKVPRGILMNSTRKHILQYLTRYPCVHLHGIAKEMGLSINNTKWHLDKLVENGYLSTQKLENKRIYYPMGMIEKKNIEILALVNNKNSDKIYPVIASIAGITQKEIAEFLDVKQQTLKDKIKKFEDYRLIKVVRDGKYKRYYPTDLIKIREKNNHNRSKEFRQIILKVLVNDGVNPNVIRSTDRNLHIQITTGKEKSDLILYLNPFERLTTSPTLLFNK